MKKGLIKKLGIGLLAGALTFLPAKKINALEDIINGSVIGTINETPVKSGVKIKAWEYLGDRIGDFVGEAVTNDNGNFSLNLDNNSSNYLKLEISHPDSSYYQAERYVCLEDSVLLYIVERHDVDVYNMETESTEKMDFMEFFNSWFRAMNGQTQRWANEDEGGKGLKVFIKTPLAVPSQIDSVYSIIQNKWPRFTQRVGKEPLIQNTHIEQGEVIPDYAKSDKDGWARIVWVNSGDPFHSEKLYDNRIYSAGVVLTPVADNRAITEELLQILGARAETPDRFFWDINGNVLESGRRCGKVVSSRPIGNKTPDINPEPQVNIIRYIRPVTNFTVSDIPDDNGNQLALNWIPSISEQKGIVSGYEIYRCVDSNFSNAVLIGSVLAGNNNFIDRNVPLNNVPYYYWIKTLGNVANYVVEKTNGSGETSFIEPPLNFRVNDVPDDNGHKLKLNWDSSPSEADGLVSWYKIYRSRNPNGIERIRNLSDFLSMNANSRLDSLNAWDGNYAVLVDSVSAGNREHIDFVPLNNTPYYYWLQAVGNKTGSAKISSKWNDVGVREENRKFNVSNAYPNPFNLSTTINYEIPEGANVNLVVYDANGRKVRTIYCGHRDGGSYKANWDGRDSKGRNVGNGVYLYQLNAGEYSKKGKMMLVK